MTHYIGVVASLAIRRSTASTQPANLLRLDRGGDGQIVARFDESSIANLPQQPSRS
jgi:hypothetical protein